MSETARLHAPAAPGRRAADAAEPEHDAATAAVAVPGLVVGRADDAAEAAADELAERALRRLTTAPAAHENAGHEHVPAGHGSAAPSAPAGAVGLSGGALAAPATARIDALRGSGRALPGPTRSRMEGAFGTSFGHVRLHEGPEAARLNASMSAAAFTTGADVFLGAGHDATSGDSQATLAHELAHVVLEGPRGPVRRDPTTKAAKKREKAEKKEQAAQERASQEQIATFKNEAYDKTRQDAFVSTGATPQAQGGADPQLVQGTRTPRDKHEFATWAASRTSGANAARRGQTSLGTATPTDGHSEAAVSTLWREFELAQQVERAHYQAAISMGVEHDAAYDAAYEHAWTNNRNPLILAVAPQRGSGAEILRLQTKEMTTRAAAKQRVSDAIPARGTFMSKDTELEYERIELEILTLVRAGQGPVDAAKERARLWRSAASEARVERPGSDDDPVHRAATDAARRRVEHANPPPVPAKKQASPNAKPLPKPLPKLTAPPRSARSGGVDKWTDRANAALDAVTTTAIPAMQGLGIVGTEKDNESRSSVYEPGVSNGYTPVLGPVSTIGGAVGDIKGAVDRVDVHGRVIPDSSNPGQTTTQDWYRTTASSATLSTETKVVESFGAVTGVLTDLLVTVGQVKTCYESIVQAYKLKDGKAALQALNSGAGAVATLSGSSRRVANLVQILDSAKQTPVIQGLPIIDIITNSALLVANITSVTTSALRYYESTDALFEARLRDAAKVDVLVHPFKRVTANYLKQLEMNSFTLAATAVRLSASIAELATAGGYGIPAAIRSTMTAVELLHGFGHYVAERALDLNALDARKESNVLHAVGGAESELRKDNLAAVQGILARAAAEDKIALDYLSTFVYEGGWIDKSLLAKITPRTIRAGEDSPQDVDAVSDDVLFVAIGSALLKDMGVTGDPLTIEKSLLGIFKEKTTVFRGIGAKVQRSFAMRSARNDLAVKGESDRSVLWAVKMVFVTKVQFDRSRAKTEAHGRARDAAAADLARPDDVQVVVPPGTCFLGGDDVFLSDHSTQQQRDDFRNRLDTMSVQQVSTFVANPRNAGAWAKFLTEYLAQRALLARQAQVRKPLPPQPQRPQQAQQPKPLPQTPPPLPVFPAVPTHAVRPQPQRRPLHADKQPVLDGQ